MGQFSYYYLNPKKYSVSIVLESVSKGRQFLIASPEKAISDVLYSLDKNTVLKSVEEMEEFLIHDLRIEKSSI